MEKYGVSLLLVVIIVLVRSGEGQLNETYYNRTCPNVEAIVRQAVEKKVNETSITIAATLRLFFHDCFVEGCDASVLVVSPDQTAERDATENLSLAGDGFDTVIKAKKAVEDACPRTVSCADILTIATRDVVSLAGGPNYTVELGRLDGNISNASHVPGNIPKPEFNLNQLNAMFVKRNLSQTDMIALTGGGHTLGFSHCNQFASRLYSFNGTNTTDPTLNSTYAKELMQACPAKNSDNDTIVPFDPLTPGKFDNAYYNNLVAGRGLLSSDQVLFTDKASHSKVVDFANNEKEFNHKFVEAMKKLGRVGVKTRKTIRVGGIRTDCTLIKS